MIITFEITLVGTLIFIGWFLLGWYLVGLVSSFLLNKYNTYKGYNRGFETYDFDFFISCIYGILVTYILLYFIYCDLMDEWYKIKRKRNENRKIKDAVKITL